jgi:DnaJ-class molecular chaperone
MVMIETNYEEVLKDYRKNIDYLPPTGNEFKSLTKVKNEHIRNIVENQMAESGRFDITPPDDACPDCRGLGEIYRLERHEVVEECRSCVRDSDGKPTGKFRKDCNTCGGTGRFKKTSFRLTINVRCKYCERDENGEPTGTKLVKCRTCQGTTRVKKFPKTGKIEKSTICKKCNGSGIKVKSTVGTPVLNTELANMLKEVLVKTK